MNVQGNSVHFNFTIMKKYILILICGILALTSCTGRYEDASDKALDYSGVVPSITMDSVNALVKAGAEFNLIDVRQQEDFWGGSLSGAINIPRGILEFKIDDEEFWFGQYMYPPTKETILIVYSSNGNTGILAGLSLIQLGYQKVYNLEGGYEKNH